MRSYLAFTYLLCTSFCIGTTAQPPDDRIQVAGRVINSVTGEAVSNALVILEGASIARYPENAQAPAPERVLTDASGAFSFSVLPGPSLSLRISRTGYRSQTGSDEEYARVEPTSASNVMVRLVPLGVIHGRVANSDGEPLPGLRVQVLRVAIREGRRNFEEDATKTTDDLGEYRLWYLSPGLYYLKVTGRYGIRVGVGESPQLSESDEAYGPLYYPSARTRDEAEPIRLHPGETIQADFRVEGRKAYKVVAALQGYTPYEEPHVQLLRGDDPVGNRVLVNLSTGIVEIFDVTPGAYAVQAFNPKSKPPRLAQADVVVENHDVSGVNLRMMEAIEVRGKVEFTGANGARAPAAFIRAMPIKAVSQLLNSSKQHAQTDAEGNFSLELFPGEYEIAAINPGGYAESISAGTQDVLANGLSVSAGGSPEVKVHMVAGGGQIVGNISGLAAGERATVVAVRKPGRLMLAALEESRDGGRFEMRDLAPGDYTVYAWPPGRAVEYQSKAALERMGAWAVRISVRDGSRDEIKVRVAPKEEE